MSSRKKISGCYINEKTIMRRKKVFSYFVESKRKKWLKNILLILIRGKKSRAVSDTLVNQKEKVGEKYSTVSESYTVKGDRKEKSILFMVKSKET